MDSKSVRNMWSSLPNKVEKWCISLAFIIRVGNYVTYLTHLNDQQHHYDSKYSGIFRSNYVCMSKYDHKIGTAI
jgi:hypothetical protein